MLLSKIHAEKKKKKKFAAMEQSELTNEWSCTVALTDVKEMRTKTVLLKVSKCYEADEFLLFQTSFDK